MNELDKEGEYVALTLFKASGHVEIPQTITFKLNRTQAAAIARTILAAVREVA